jgi:hypothetical protein
MFEIQAGLARIALSRGETQLLEIAQAHVHELTNELLHEQPTEQTHILPMGLYLICIRVAQACKDPYTAQLITCANEELRSRLAKITDVSLRPAYLNITEHRDILNFMDTLPLEMQTTPL